MPEGDDTGSTGGTTTFTQADVDRIVRERVKRERDKYADYDDLKTAAGEADKNKSALEQLLTKVSGLEERATKAERAALRAEVATAKKLPAWMAKRLTGNTREELEADADEMLAESGASAKGDTDGKADDAGESGGDGKGGESSKDTAGKAAAGKSSDSTAEGEGRKLPPSGRPKEKLTSGATSATSGEKSAADLADEILKSDFL